MRSEPIIKLKNDQDLYMHVQIETFEFIPILFVAKDKDQGIYLCLCSEIRDIQRWIVTETDIGVLSQLIRHKITINEALKRHGDAKHIVEYSPTDGFYSVQLSFDQINPLFLAEPDVYAEYVQEEAEDYVTMELKKVLYSYAKHSESTRIPPATVTSESGDIRMYLCAASEKSTVRIQTIAREALDYRSTRNLNRLYGGFPRGYKNSGGIVDLGAA